MDCRLQNISRAAALFSFSWAGRQKSTKNDFSKSAAHTVRAWSFFWFLDVSSIQTYSIQTVFVFIWEMLENTVKLKLNKNTLK
jgi:hypothetical protein